MIKFILSGKSLKQLFIIGLISCFILLGNSFVNAWDSYGVNGSTSSCNLYLDDVGEINGFSEGYNVNITNLGNFMTYSDLGNTNIFYTYSNSLRFMWAWIDGKLYHNSYMYYSTVQPASKLQGFIDKIKVVPSSCLNDFSCVSEFNDYSTGNIITNDEFADLNLTFVKYGVFATNGQSNNCSVNPSIIFGGLVFLATDGNFYSVACQGGRDYPSYCPSGVISGSSLGLDSDLNYENLLNYSFSNSPFVSSSSSDINNQIDIIDFPDGYDYTKFDSGDIVFYFENSPLYRFDKNVCYVGTTDYSTLYSSGSTLGLFKWGSGGSVFDLYGSQYGNSFTIKDLGTFINTWNINYYTWFKGANRDENNKPIYNAYYSLASGFYQDFSDNLSVPFIGNPIAFYFMGYVSSLYGNQSTLGEEIATYCYYKLNYDDDSGNFNITDNSNGSYWNNANDYINQHNRFYGLNSGGINIEAQSWDGSILDYYSGYDEKYDFNTFFSSSFNKFKDVISLNPSDLGAGVLPTYIILFLMAIILFRFLSH